MSSCTSIPKRQGLDETIELLEKGEDIKKIVDALSKPLIKSRATVGMVVAVVTPQGQKIFTYGHADKLKKTKLSEDSLFQVGSITKLFTTSAISIMAKKGLINFNDKISNYFPKGFHPDHQSINNISIDQIVTHTSGLDREHQSFGMALSAVKFLFTGKNIWGHFKKRNMFEYFQESEVDESEIGNYGYSNTAYTLLGEVMSNVEAGKSYSDQVKEKVLAPLGLNDTVFVLNEDQRSRLASGHVGSIPPFMLRGSNLEPWYIDKGLWSAGSLYSTAKDLLTFLKVNMGIEEYEHYDILKEAQEPRFKTDEGYVGRSWFIDELPITKNAFTNIRGYFSGHISFMGFDLEKRVGVIVLQNSLNYKDNVGVPLLDRIVKFLNKSPEFGLVGLEDHNPSEKRELFVRNSL